MSVQQKSGLTYIITDEDAAVSLEQHRRDMTAFVEHYGIQIISTFEAHGVKYITREQKPCLITLHGGTMFNFADDGALFEFLSLALKLDFEFCQKFVCVDFCRWYAKTQRSKNTTAVIGDEDWTPTPKQIDHIKTLEQAFESNPDAQILIVQPHSYEENPNIHFACGTTDRQNHLKEFFGHVISEDDDALPYVGWHDSYKKDETVTFPLKSDLEAPLTFSDAPFKIVRNYLYACGFLSPYAPTFIDYANDLLAYQLGYHISQEKVAGPIAALHSLRREISDYVKNHSDACANLRAEPDINPVAMTLYSDRLVLRSDYGHVVVTYEPNTTSVEWEKRYIDLRTRHGQR